MAETVRELLARLGSELDAAEDWMEICSAQRGSDLVGGELRCRKEAVEFEADDGLTATIPYAEIRAIFRGHQGAAEAPRKVFEAQAAIGLRAVG